MKHCDTEFAQRRLFCCSCCCNVRIYFASGGGWIEREFACTCERGDLITRKITEPVQLRNFRQPTFQFHRRFMGQEITFWTLAQRHPHSPHLAWMVEKARNDWMLHVFGRVSGDLTRRRERLERSNFSPKSFNRILVFVLFASSYAQGLNYTL